jgi:glycosyltransferase involved in cell wall biosynthesis
MKIGYFVSHYLYPDRVDRPGYPDEYAHGGTEIAAYHLAQEMGRRGHQVEVFTTALDNRSVVEMDKVTIHRYATQFRVASANFSWGLIQRPQKVEVDLAHAHYNMPYADYSALLYSRKMGVPLVVTYHADASETSGSRLRNQLQIFYNRYLLPRVLEEADIIITTSESYMKESHHLEGYQEKIRVIPNGINLEEFQTALTKRECRERLGLPLDKVIILFFGNLVPYKGTDILLKAFSKVHNDYDDVMLLYVGRGPLKGELQSLSQELGLEDDVVFAGYVDDPDKAIYYQAADIFSLPSVNRAEAFGIVNLEAMASGLPIVASRLGGILDLVQEGGNGILFKPEKVEELARALGYLVDNPEERERMGCAGKKMAEDYSWAKIARRTEEVYRELLEGL